MKRKSIRTRKGQKVTATRDLWERTHLALIEHNWSEARSLLDDLGRKRDNHDRLSSAAAYGVPELLRSVISDRINLVNSKVV